MNETLLDSITRKTKTLKRFESKSKYHMSVVLDTRTENNEDS